MRTHSTQRTAHRLAGRRGQSMVEYLLIASAIVAAVLGFRGAIDGGVNQLMDGVATQMQRTSGTADALLQ